MNNDFQELLRTFEDACDGHEVTLVHGRLTEKIRNVG